MHLALFEPDIAGNVGAAIRLAACLDFTLHVIEPCGFPFSAKALRRAGMDYIDLAQIEHHRDFDAFDAWRASMGGRLVLLTTKADADYLDTAYQANDILLVGRESSGAPDWLHARADARVKITTTSQARSLNMATALAIVVSEARRQIFHATTSS